MGNKRVGIVAGHKGKGSGAHGFVDEALHNVVCANAMRDYLINYPMETFRDPLNNEFREEYAWANKLGLDIMVNVHANAGGGDGWEAWVYDKKAYPAAYNYAKLVEAEIKKLGQNSRGIKESKNFLVLKANCPSIILENFFVDNKKDSQIADTVAEQKAFGYAQARALLKYFKIADKGYQRGGKASVITKITTKKYSGTFPVLPKQKDGYYYLKKGDTGLQVLCLQKFLNWAINAGLKEDKSFGTLTERAVKDFERAYGLVIDGLFGKACLAKAKVVKK